MEEEPVVGIVAEPVQPLLEVDLSDGSSVRATANHVFWVEGGPRLHHAGWLQAGQLEPGNRLRTAGGKQVTVLALRWNVGEAVVYTITVAKDHTFFVGSAQVLVHNANRPCDFYNNGIELTQSQRINLRRNAQRIWERVMGYRASSRGWEIHHRIPLEYAHLFPDRYNPNNYANIVGMPVLEHDELEAEWTTWRTAHPSPSLAEVFNQAYHLDTKYKAYMHYLR